MHDEQVPTWQERLANLRAGKPQSELQTSLNSNDFSQEALMTIIAIMKDNDDPKLQMAAAKMVLDRNIHVPTAAPLVEHHSLDADDIECAIALAKAVLDELANRKTQKLDGAGEVAIDGASGADNTER